MDKEKDKDQDQDKRALPLLIIYDIFIGILAMSSVIMVILDMAEEIDITSGNYQIADYVILGVFWIDYLGRFSRAEDKKYFVTHNAVDLLAILPLTELLTFFRLFRVYRIVYFLRFIRAFAFLRVFNRRMGKFVRTNGFIYMLYTAVALIFLSALTVSEVEKKPFVDTLWWAIVTCTTVGYGDITPSSYVGKAVAVVLMIFGVGIIGMLTGTIMTFFNERRLENERLVINDELLNTIKTLTQDEQEELLSIAHLLHDDKLVLNIVIKRHHNDKEEEIINIER